MFLIYLLLYRLEHRLPTAVQFQTQSYLLFDEQGVLSLSVDDIFEPRLCQCWALADSNSRVSQPCAGFETKAGKLVIQASLPNPSRWKEWLKQARGWQLWAELPTMLEIAAVL